jgi:hypothetical protein
MVKKVLVTLTIIALVVVVFFFGINLGFSQQELEAAQIRISSLQATVASQESRLSTTEVELQTVKSELETAQNYLSSAEAELEATELKLSSLQIDEFHLHNPTLEEVASFLEEDKTDSNQYVEDKYVCSHFATDVNNNADQQGIRCAYVDVRFPDSAHAIVAFDTTDKGLIYFDPSTDEQVRPVVGMEYWRCIEPKPGYHYTKPAFNDTIVDILVVW